MNSFVLPAATLWQRELVRFWRQKSRVMGVVASPLVFWLLLGYGSNDLAKFYSGALVLTVMFSAIFSTISIIEDRREGFLLSMLVSPAPRTSLVLGKILGSATLAWIQGMLFLLVRAAGGFSPGTRRTAHARDRHFPDCVYADRVRIHHGVENGIDFGLSRHHEPGAVSHVDRLRRGFPDGDGSWMDQGIDVDQPDDIFASRC